MSDLHYYRHNGGNTGAAVILVDIVMHRPIVDRLDLRPYSSTVPQCQRWATGFDLVYGAMTSAALAVKTMGGRLRIHVADP